MRMKRVVSILAVAVLVFGLTGCNAITIDGETENVSGEAAGNGSIGFSISTLNNPFFVTLSEGAKEKAKTEGEKLIVVDAGDDAAKQTSDIEDLISKNISVLIVNPVDSDAVAPAVKDAVSRGIKVISVDRGVNGVDVDCAIASDNVEGAKMATEYMVSLLGENAKVAELEGVSGASATIERGKGFHLVADEKLDVVSKQTANFNRSEGMSVMENMLQANSAIQGVFAHNDEMALGAVEAVGNKKILVVGFDATDDAVAAVKAGKMAATAGAGYAKNLRHDIFYKVQEFSFKNIDRFSTSGLVTRMTTDITNVQMAYMMSIRLLARAPIMIVLSWIMTLLINKKIALLFLIIIPLLGGTLIFIAKKAHPHFIKVFDEYDILNNSVQENVNASRVVKAFVREDHEIEKFHGISKYVYTLFTKAEKIVAWNSPVMQFTIYTAMLLMVAIGGREIVFGAMEIGEMTSVIVYAFQIMMALMMVTFVFVMIMIAEASTDRITEVLTEVPEMQDKKNAVTEVADGEIRFEHVDFSYAGEGGNLSLKDVNLHIKSGQTIGIIGGTGSAKSTLVQLIPRLYDVTKGTVKVGGLDVREYNLEALRDQVSMVLQKNVLFTGTIYDNIRWGNEHASEEEVQRVCKLAQADGFVKEFPAGYHTMIVQGGNNVSGGQKQRLCIARALLKKPKILILDDSTSAVDTKTDALIRKAFREEIPDTTKIIIAQRVSSIENADQIIVLDEGKIMGVGTSEELLATNEIYREVYESQVKGGEDDE